MNEIINRAKYIHIMEDNFETDYVTIRYDKANHIIVLKWKAAPASSEFREGLNALISVMDHFKTGKLIADTTFLGIIHPDDQKWSAADWFQRALKVGYCYVAIVLPYNILTERSVEDTMNQTEYPFPTVYFDNQEEALMWIKKNATTQCRKGRVQTYVNLCKLILKKII